MPHLLLECAPDDTSQKLRELKGGELLSFFRSLHWDLFLCSHLSALTVGELKPLLVGLKNALPAGVAENVILPEGDSESSDFLDEFRSLYVSPSSHIDFDSVTASSVVGDIERDWSARRDDESGRTAVARQLVSGL